MDTGTYWYLQTVMKESTGFFTCTLYVLVLTGTYRYLLVRMKRNMEKKGIHLYCILSNNTKQILIVIVFYSISLLN